MVLRALVTERQQRGNLFAPMHWTGQFASSGRVDVLVPPNVDPHSGQPALKMAEVRAEPFHVKHYGFFVSAAPPRLDMAYWAVAKADGGFRGELAWSEEPADWSASIRAAFDLPPDLEMIRYADERSGRRSYAALSNGRLIFALYVSRDPVLVARQWAVELLKSDRLDGTSVLAGRPGGDIPDPGPIVCACHAVGQNTIIEAARTKGCRTVGAIGVATRAGTNCGVCRSEIGALLEKEVSRIL